MPITPLHMGLLAPINHIAPKKVSFWAFFWANVWMDWDFILRGLTGMPLPDHSNHTLLNALVAGVLVSALGISTRRPWYPRLSWISGAFLGAISHVLVDMLVHPDMVPFYPWGGNPFYMGWMEPVSFILLALCCWLTLQIVSGILAHMRKLREGSPPEHSEPD